jgi:hypothetical protein
MILWLVSTAHALLDFLEILAKKAVHRADLDSTARILASVRTVSHAIQ